MRHHALSGFPLRPPIEQLRAIRTVLKGYLHDEGVDVLVEKATAQDLPEGADFLAVIIHADNYGGLDERIAFEALTRKSRWKPITTGPLGDSFTGGLTDFDDRKYVMQPATREAFDVRYKRTKDVPWHEGNGVLVVPVRIGTDELRESEFELDFASTMWLLVGSTLVIEAEGVELRIACRGSRFKGRGGRLFVPTIVYSHHRLVLELLQEDGLEGYISFKGVLA